MTKTEMKMRRQITAMRTMAELVERFPELPEFDMAGTVGSGTLRFTARFWTFDSPGAYDRVDGKDPADVKREAVERHMTTAMDALHTVVGRTLEWTKNDPTKDVYEESYYTLEAALGDVAKIRLITERAVVCERVVVLTGTEEVEERDPELVEKALEQIPVKVVKKPKEIVEWQCNPVLAAKTNPVSVSASA